MVARGVDRADLEVVRSLSDAGGLITAVAGLRGSAIQLTQEAHAGLGMRERETRGRTVGRRIRALTDARSGWSDGVEHQSAARDPAVVALAALPDLSPGIRARDERVGAVACSRGHRQFDASPRPVSACESRNRAPPEADPAMSRAQCIARPRGTSTLSPFVDGDVGHRDCASRADRHRCGGQRAHDEVRLRRLCCRRRNHGHQRDARADPSEHSRSHTRSRQSILGRASANP